MVQWENRLRLMKQHLKQLDADVIGVSEIDGVAGGYAEANWEFMELMTQLGYGNQYFEKLSGVSGSAVFWKTSKFVLVDSHWGQFGEGSS